MSWGIPKYFEGKDVEKAYEKAMKENDLEKRSKEQKQTTGVPTSSGEHPPASSELRVVDDKNMYDEIVNYHDKKFPDFRNILSGKLKWDEEKGVMKDSNAYIPVGVDMFLKENNSKYRVSTQLDLEQNLDFTRGTVNDTALALRSLSGENSEEANYLFEQMKKQGISEEDFPIWVNLRGLELESEGGRLYHKLTEESFYKTAEFLNWPNRTKFSEVNEYGWPKSEVHGGNRTLYTSNKNAVCFLVDGSDLDSSGPVLGNSNDYGRVVLAKPRSG